MTRLLLCMLFIGLPLSAQWKPLFNGKDLSGWEVIHDGLWHVTSEGVVTGQRDRSNPAKTNPNQSWLYTKAEYGEYDLHLEYWLRYRDNSGISIRDTTRARYSGGPDADPKRTPSHNGYEIQIMNGHTDKYPTGSLYLFQAAKPGVQREFDWNSMDLEVRNEKIRVKVNGVLVMEHSGDPQRPTKGPIGLQLHDMNTVVMFRNVRIRTVR